MKELTFEMTCERLYCKMQFCDCVARQELARRMKGKRVGIFAKGPWADPQCLECEQGKEIARHHKSRPEPHRDAHHWSRPWQECKHPECYRRSKRKGLCRKHYARMNYRKAHGLPNIIGNYTTQGKGVAV